ncbi:MAG: hydrogenase maturation nickel metallochaperone HypA [candidate division Zixibacteria bacterium]|nr:hydrogenase maturation nickel metallochaperone HypA [candidate division Zixibacteria bacterium]
MHEFSIVQDLMELAEDELGKIGYTGKVNSLTLVIGKLSGANPDSVSFAYDAISPQTRLKGAKLIIKEPSAVCICGGCGVNSELAGIDYRCPLCGSGDVKVEGGRELRLDSMELED